MSSAAIKPLGNPIRVSRRGRKSRNHYNSFDCGGVRYDLEDSVMITPDESTKRPYVALIKDIFQVKKEAVMIGVQWFYRPEDACRKLGGHFEPVDTRELFYSFHRDDIYPQSITNKVVIHFIDVKAPQLPLRKKYPGFVVQKVYDPNLQVLRDFDDKYFDDNIKREINLLLQKTASRLSPPEILNPLQIRG